MDKAAMINILEQVAAATARARDDLVLCGGMAAFAICKMADAEADVALTEDVDLAMERQRHRQKTKLAEPPLLGDDLKKSGFSCEYKSLPIGGGIPAEKWVKEGESFYIEFLTEDHNQNVHSISGISAQGLSYFSMSLANTFPYELPSGTSIRVVSPEAFAMHKILTFNRRRSDFKKYKDLYYVAIVALTAYRSIGQLAADMRALRVAQGWQRTAASNLRAIEKSLGDWTDKIMGNDPARFLTAARIRIVYITLAAAYAEIPEAVMGNAAEARAPDPTRICAACGKFFRTRAETGAGENTGDVRLGGSGQAGLGGSEICAMCS